MSFVMIVNIMVVGVDVTIVTVNKQMNDLRLLYQTDPSKTVITLQFKNIATLEPMMPLLSKFERLESLSLSGNRLTSLPADMSSLKELQELDISNNMISDLKSVISSLKTLPNLSHLIVNFKNSQEESDLKYELPRLEKINKKVVNSFKSDVTFSNRKKKKADDLTEQDLESVAILFDEIRAIYRDSKYLVDKELNDDFSRNLDNILGELIEKNKQSESEVEKNCNTLCGKYALIDLCFVKIITYFYHFDKKIANVLEQIHDYQADMFKAITDLVIEEDLRTKIEITAVRTKKEDLYKAEIRRLKTLEAESCRLIEYQEAENRKLLDKLLKYTKTDVLESTLGRALSAARSPHSHSGKRDNSEKVHVSDKPKVLTVNQLKEVMREIYKSKRNHDQACLAKKEPYESLEVHMYTYLNQKYGLKSIAVEWAMSIVNAIRKYGSDDPEVATFGKILRNQVQEGMAADLEKLKKNLHEGIKRFKQNVSAEPSTDISLFESGEVLLCMGLRREQSAVILSHIPESKVVNNTISVETLERALQDYFVQQNDLKTASFYQQFKALDRDENGIIDLEDLRTLIQKIQKGIDVEVLASQIDPSSTGVILYSPLLELLLKAPEVKHYFKVPES